MPARGPAVLVLEGPETLDAVALESVVAARVRGVVLSAFVALLAPVALAAAGSRAGRRGV